MEKLTIVLFERIGLLLLFAFIMSRIPTFKYMLDQDLKGKRILLHSFIFGIFGIMATQAGVLVSNGKVISHFWIVSVPHNTMLVGSSLVAIVIAGLFGGPKVGFGAGMIVALYIFYLGGDGTGANALIHPVSGLITGFTARFFSKDRIIAPEKTLFIGMFMPILHMCLLLIFTDSPEHTIRVINAIGIPLVITNSIAIAVFTAMIHLVLREKEQEAAVEATRALKIADLALPFLKQDLTEKTAKHLAELLIKELNVAAVSLTDRERVLAHVGLGSDHHTPGQPIQTELSLNAIKSGEIQIAYDREEIKCKTVNCPLQAAIIVPILQSGSVKGLIKIYFKKALQIRQVEIALSKGLGRLISNQLDILAIERMKELIQEAELRNLQAQINPHFLFNTLNSIGSLIRRNPDKARHLIVQLSIFMRFNFKLAAEPLIPLKKEIEHVQAYIEIVKERFSDQLHIQFHVPQNIEKVNIPPFTIQPLVENSLLHGLKDVERNGLMIVKIGDFDDHVKVEVTDNGKGIPEELLHRLGQESFSFEKGNGTGIYNVNQRLISLLGPNAHLQFGNLRSGGCCVSFCLPKVIGEAVTGYENQSVNR
ncbi:MAG: LytS/YhcK type 5TM receptor domain-containing protein [Tuberibacillus sp.]